MTKTVDWKKVAKDHGMTTEEFQKELLHTAAAMGTVLIEQNNAKNGAGNNQISMTYHDKNGNPDMRLIIEDLRI